MTSVDDAPVRQEGATESLPRQTVLEKIGLPKGMSFGVLGMIIFVVGDALEVTWITNFFSTGIGIPLASAAWIVTAFGICGAVGAYVVGPLTNVLGPRRVMLIGLFLWAAVDAVFISVALPSENYWLILAVYALRGLGQPLFGFAFLIWLTKRARAGHEARTQAWFWFCLSGGQQILGVAVAGLVLPVLGPLGTLWIGLGIALAGGLVAVLLIRDPTGIGSTKVGGSVSQHFLAGLSIIWRQPKVGVGGLVKIINIGGILAVTVYYVPYLTTEIKVPLSQAVLAFTILGITGVPGNLVWGWLSDRLGWANTVQWVASPINAICIALLFWVPQWAGANFVLIAVVMLVWGVGTSAYVPISALVPALAPKEKPAALGVINLSTGVASLLGPAIVAIVLPGLGFQGVTWAVVALYVLSFLLMFYVQLPGRARTTADLPVDEADVPLVSVPASPPVTL
ncbi:MFS transporter [Frondihabitans sucicola]|uniref:MFS transporter n=1 Tax=Frondihabitans sucicola TaxID=1268041 RepID=A0ABM8GKW1_9MICO|nr:MFS transporter [Frondihabitans sucicola]BDZ48843.1 MFS transporter [Frondihabitans sucicola]